MTDSGFNQILVIIDHFTKLAEAMPCQTRHEGHEKITREKAWTVHENGGTPAGTVLSLEYRACSAL